ncbi:glycosyl hydrolase family 88 [Parablautia intestinalis]|uniref:glycosyl hydrolase family 88 n=1 Tax=Parablautia intestinalis TaxID=2320100 RepID=UPI00256F5608|nr:glycosyl hydrolase family 88 [Parablautia intestinalis]
MTKKKLILCAALLLLIVAATVPALLFLYKGRNDTTPFQEKVKLLQEYALADWVYQELGDAPAGEAGNVVFLSVSDGTSRASVYTGTGVTLDEAWLSAVNKADSALKKKKINPKWVKADVIYSSETVQTQELFQIIGSYRHEFFRYGVSFDENFQTALLEAELNGAKIYDYENGGINRETLNRYLKALKRSTLKQFPLSCTLFQCAGWICDEDNTVYELSASGLDYGRRKVDILDADYAKDLILNASNFLVNQVKEDGSFIYGIYPRFDEEIENYNIVRHASSLWSLICRYRLSPDQALAEKINQTIDYMLTQIIYDPNGRAYLYEKKDDEIKLGGCGLAVVALTEYMEVFDDNRYKDVCCALGEGILSLFDQASGEYYHVLNGDFSQKEAFRTVYYDGEATFALCRLYGLTKNKVWLDAAQSAVEHFIQADYTQYKDHWVAYSMNEITKYIPDNMDYYAFALENAQVNLEEIKNRDTTYHTYLELLMATFEIYDRMVENGGLAAGFDLETFLNTIYTRADRQLNGYFYPEYAMYMDNPERILNTFMVRHDGYRVRIDDVQHNIGGYYLYYMNYDKLIAYGMLDTVGK